MIQRELRTTRGLFVGRVRDAVTGEALSGLDVVLGLRLGQQGELTLARSATDREGLFRFLTYPGFRAGPHQWGVLAGNSFRRAAPGSPYGFVESVILAGQPLSRTVLLQPVTRLGGRVVQGGVPVPGVALTLTNATSGAELETDVQTGPDGLFSLTDQDSDLFGFGNYEVSVPPTVVVSIKPSLQQPASTDPPVEVSLRPGDRKSVTISLP